MLESDVPANMLKVGIVGVGRMGMALATRFNSAGVVPHLYNRSRARAIVASERLRCPHFATARELAAQCDLVFITISNGTASNGVYDGPDGLLADAKNGLVLVETSTLGPPMINEIHRLVHQSGGRFLEASFTGRPADLETGNAFIMTGGENAELSVVKPYLELLGMHRHAGGVGANAAMKLAMNSIAFAYMTAASEALEVAEKAGLGRATALDLLLASPVATPILKARMQAFLDPSGSPVQGTIGMARGILDQYRALATTLSVQTPNADSVSSLLGAAVEAGYGERDVTTIAKSLIAPSFKA